ncbi:MAG TPA: molybdopterin-dependent oxidoreductase [Candidatus Acidoferrales bacterium]|nr:molybdopterin-dependent oxidoreductase [Candidatus Acidoferrales bacterium]
MMDDNSNSDPKAPPLYTRRRFLAASASAIALASIPAAARVARGDAQSPALKFGGPTPNSKFYLTSYGGTPEVDVKSWRFAIKGLVDNAFELSYDDVRKLPAVEQPLTLECISNPPDGTAISHAVWTGTKLRPLLERARVKPGAKFVAMRGADGYHTVLPVEELMRAENFLPYMMNGLPLPPEHGFPLRIFIPGKYGMKQPKWITELEFADHEIPGYWETRGWSDTAWRKVNSGFFSPKIEGGMLSIFDRKPKVAAPLDIYGWALAGPSGIKRVEVSADDGATWRDAEIVENSSPYVWTVWKFRLAPTGPGNVMIRVRATDGDGIAQPEADPQTGSGMSGQARMGLEVTQV